MAKLLQKSTSTTCRLKVNPCSPCVRLQAASASTILPLMCFMGYSSPSFAYSHSFRVCNLYHTRAYLTMPTCFFFIGHCTRFSPQKRVQVPWGQPGLGLHRQEAERNLADSLPRIVRNRWARCDMRPSEGVVHANQVALFLRHCHC